MCEINIKTVTVYIVLVIGSSTAARLDVDVFKNLLKGRASPPIIYPEPAQGNTILSQVQEAYSKRQKSLFDDIREVLGDAFDEAEDAEMECNSCRYVPSDGLDCYASCLTKRVGVFEEYSSDISTALNNLICKTMGFKFLEEYYKNASHPIWTDFQLFTNEFNGQKDAFSVGILTEIWLGNLLLLDRSPLVFYTLLHQKLKSDLIVDETIVDLNTKSQPTFATDCENNFARDMVPLVHALVKTAKDKAFLMDIILRGAFLIRSAHFYTLGSYQNAAGAVIEAMGAFIGKKCNLLTEGSTSDCDNYGRYPVPNFPIPKQVAIQIGIDCNPEPVAFKPPVVPTTNETTGVVDTAMQSSI